MGGDRSAGHRPRDGVGRKDRVTGLADDFVQQVVRACIAGDRIGNELAAAIEHQRADGGGIVAARARQVDAGGRGLQRDACRALPTPLVTVIVIDAETVRLVFGSMPVTVRTAVPARPVENTQQIAWPVSEWTWMLVQLIADSSSGVLASSGMWMLATSTGLMLQLMSWPETGVPSALRHMMSTSVENGDAGNHGEPPLFSGIVVDVACNVMVPLCGAVKPPPSPPPPPQLARARLASSSPMVLPKNFMSCLQAC